MADGLCKGVVTGDDFVEKSQQRQQRETIDVVPAKEFSSVGKSDQMMCGEDSPKSEDEPMPSSDEECRRKRCVERYDSSESSDSGVATLSCTDCSGSSTASSDIADPGSPFSTASNHSEDSLTSAKMPPTQNHSPWSWTAEDRPLLRQNVQDAKKKQKKQQQQDQKMHQGKITEYFKTHVKPAFKKTTKKTPTQAAVDRQTQFDGAKAQTRRTAKKTPASKSKKFVPSSVPRKILPAPAKTDALGVRNNVGNIINFPLALSTVNFTPNLTYLHTKVPKPPDGLFAPQYASITDKINAIPIIPRTPCLNVIQPKIATINNFSCVKLNATVVPIVKVNNVQPKMALIAPKQLGECQPVNVCQPVVAHCLSGVVAAAPKAYEPSSVCQLDASLSRVPSPDDSGVCSDRSSVETTSSDSGLSASDKLEVKVNVPVTVECQKSPILSKPKTIRFPFKQKELERRDSQKSLSSGDSGVCRWAECGAQFDTSGALLEHLQHKHVISQATRDEYTCFWSGCKVHGRTSCSRSWLERHVLAHAGTKLFRCIVDGCRQRFNSQLALQRHVNGHFNADGKPTDPAKKSPENSSTKLFKRNGKKIRFRRQPWSARMFDFIDCGIMEGVQHKLMSLTQRRTGGDISVPGDEIRLQSEVLARRIGNDGTTNFLIRWHPLDIVSDEWVTEKEFKTTKAVKIPSLDASAKDALIPVLGLRPQRSRKHSRKPSSRQT